jgi:hypothetical protein
MLGRMIDPIIVIAGLVIASGAILRRLIGGRMDARNIEQLRRRHGLDSATAEQLYRLARRDGFGSAWQTLIEGRRVPARTVEPDKRQRDRRTDPTRQPGGRRLADRQRV